MTDIKTGSWRGMMRRAEVALEHVANADSPATGNVAHITSAEALEKRIRVLNGELIQLQGEVERLTEDHERKRVEMVRLQAQYAERFKSHMMGWRVQLDPPATDEVAP